MIRLFVFYCLLVSAFAWLPPERCAQLTFRPRSFLDTVSTVNPREAAVVQDIEEVVAKHKQYVESAYKNARFYGIPISKFDVNLSRTSVTMQAPHNCSLFTHEPRLLAPVVCSAGTNCKLAHTVSTVQSYTATEGYNWAAKGSTKFSVIPGVFEVGGEASAGGTYTCAYTKGRTTTDLVECSTSQTGHLQLYLVYTDLKCEFGTISLRSDKRDGIYYIELTDSFTQDEKGEIMDSKASRSYSESTGDFWVMIDTDKISNQLARKILKKVPHFNPYTDLFLFPYPMENHRHFLMSLFFYKPTSAENDYSAILPFTNTNGDSIFSYACQLSPL